MSFASFPVPASVNVNTHVKMTGNKKFECVKCSYKTDWKSNLKKHLLIQCMKISDHSSVKSVRIQVLER